MNTGKKDAPPPDDRRNKEIPVKFAGILNNIARREDYFPLDPKKHSRARLRRCFVELAKQYHPDINPGFQQYATLAMQKINRWYEELAPNFPEKSSSQEDNASDPNTDTDFIRYHGRKVTQPSTTSNDSLSWFTGNGFSARSKLDPRPGTIIFYLIDCLPLVTMKNVLEPNTAYVQWCDSTVQICFIDDQVKVTKCSGGDFGYEAILKVYEALGVLWQDRKKLPLNNMRKKFFRGR